MRNLKHMAPLLAFVISALVLGGCLGITSIGNNQNVVSGGKPNQPQITIPPSDAELAPHVPHELIVGLEPGADATAIAQAVNAEIIGEIKPIGALRLRLNETGHPVTDALRELSQSAPVRYAQPNYTDYRLFGAPAPDDPDFEAHQYGPQRIHAPAAWAQGITGLGTIVAVLDTGIDSGHPDLAGNVLQGFNTMDVNYDTTDAHGHGTHVSGIAAAIADNGIGMAGIAPEAKILPLKVFNDNGLSTDFAIALAITIAADPLSVPDLGFQPADVINMSFGGLVYSQLQQDAINFALERNIVVVAAMGNDFKQAISYPAANEGVIAVGATDPRDRRADFSTTGPHISVAAPGLNIYSAVPGGDFDRWSGTSMATPHVAAAVALIREQHPGLSPIDVQRLLEQTADATSGFTQDLGYGRIDVARALDIGEVANDSGSLKLTLTDVLDRFVVNADIILYRQEQLIGNIRTGGYVAGYEGTALFHDLAPGSDYYLTIHLDPAIHGIHMLELVEGIEVHANERTEISVELNIP